MNAITDMKQVSANESEVFSLILTILHSNIVRQLKKCEGAKQVIGTYGNPSSKMQLATREED